MQLRFKVAGMSDMGLVRTNNEDNFQIARDLSVEPMRWINNEACLLTPYGTLLVVADGMGGMNAGEVASQIAIDTVKSLFTPANISQVDLTSDEAVNGFIAHTVVEADRLIKETAAANPETHGMGTTIVIAWLLDGKLYVGWCGDSRAYVYNPSTGLRRLTKDHSYVQTLVDAGKLTDEQAFDYPQSNIITRCLSDSNVVAEPEVLPQPYEVADGDLILLCTDGLCGMIRDFEIDHILRNHNPADLTATVQSLIDGALAAAGADNVTIAMLHVITGGLKPTTKTFKARKAAAANAGKNNDGKGGFLKSKAGLLTVVGGVAVGIIVAIICFLLLGNKNSDADILAKANIEMAKKTQATTLDILTQPTSTNQEDIDNIPDINDLSQEVNNTVANIVGDISIDRKGQSTASKETGETKIDSTAVKPSVKKPAPDAPQKIIKGDTPIKTFIDQHFSGDQPRARLNRFLQLNTKLLERRAGKLDYIQATDSIVVDK